MTVLHISGPRGTGKSVVAWEIFSRVTQEGVVAGYIDLAQLSFQRPAHPDLIDHNLRTVAKNYRAAGARCLIISGDARHSLPGATLCWLNASHAQLVQRLLMRGRGDGPPVPGDELRGQPPDQLRRLAYVGEPPGHADAVIDTDNLTVPEAATLVCTQLKGWLPRT